MSSKAVFDGKKALRGGAPICFPQFSDLGPVASQHGFARNSKFEVAEGELDPSGVNKSHNIVKLVLRHNDETLKMWPHEFMYSITFTLKDQGIEIDVEVMNQGQCEVEFTTALHTYFAVKDITQVGVHGLHAVQYLDSLQGRVTKRQQDEVLRFPGEVDRIYLNTPNEIIIADEATGRHILVSKAATLFDAVVWNPWVEKARATSDLGDEEYKNFVCVEVGRCGSPIVLPAQATWKASCKFEALEAPPALACL